MAIPPGAIGIDAPFFAVTADGKLLDKSAVRGTQIPDLTSRNSGRIVMSSPTPDAEGNYSYVTHRLTTRGPLIGQSSMLQSTSYTNGIPHQTWENFSNIVNSGQRSFDTKLLEVQDVENPDVTALAITLALPPQWSGVYLVTEVGGVEVERSEILFGLKEVDPILSLSGNDRDTARVEVDFLRNATDYAARSAWSSDDTRVFTEAMFLADPGSGEGRSSRILSPAGLPTGVALSSTYIAFWLPTSIPYAALLDPSSAFGGSSDVSAFHPIADRQPLTVDGVAGYYYPSLNKFNAFLAGYPYQFVFSPGNTAFPRVSGPFQAYVKNISGGNLPANSRVKLYAAGIFADV